MTLERYYSVASKCLLHGALTRAGRNTGRAVAAYAAIFLLSLSTCAQEPTAKSRRQAVPLTLRQAVDMALQRNRRMRIAQLSVEDNKAKQSTAKSNYYPHISNLSSALYLTELQGVTIPKGALGSPSATGAIPGRNITVGQGAQDAFTSGTGLTQPITQLFRIHAGDKAATADLRIAQLGEQDTDTSISLLVHQLYFQVLIEQAHLEAAVQSVSAAQIAERESVKAVSEGHSLEVATLQAHAAMLDQKQAVLTQQLTIDDTMLQLDDAVGLPLGTPLVLEQRSIEDLPDIPSRDEALASVAARNPKVLSARQTVEKAKSGVDAARAAYIPDITGLARYSYQSGVPFLVHNFGTFGGTVTFDIFDGGARAAKLKQARIELEIAETELQQTEADTRIQVSAAYDKAERLEQLVAITEEALKARTEAARVSTEQVIHDALLESASAKDAAAVSDTNASLLEARLSLYLAQNSIQQLLGQRP